MYFDVTAGFHVPSSGILGIRSNIVVGGGGGAYIDFPQTWWWSTVPRTIDTDKEYSSLSI